MSRKNFSWWFLMPVALCVAALPMTAQEQGEMGAEDAAMMQAWQEAMTPGEAHAELAATAGTWKVTTKFWQDPSAEPMVSTGTAERKMILGGRVLEESVDMVIMGMPFEGIALTGFDNVTGEHWSTWTDNMSTGLMMLTGGWDEEAGAMVMTGEASDPMTGKVKHVKMMVRNEGPDKEIGEFYEPGPDGGMIKTMELLYERQ